jgi:gliding motility-associated-like protein
MRIEKVILFLIIAGIASTLAETQGQVYDFTANVTEGCDSFKVKFTFISNASVDTLTDFAWDFGNGNSSYVRNPDTVLYNAPGVYTVTMFYGSSAANMLNNIIAKYNYIIVHPTVPANFTYADTNEYAYYAVSFKHETSPYSNFPAYLWDFDDGTTSNRKDTIHQFPGPGTYNVKLKTYYPYGCSDSTQQAIVVTRPANMPLIVPSNDFGCGSLNVDFSLANVDTDTISSIFWDFGNGQTSVQIDPETVNYNNPGYYNVRLLINNDTAHTVVERNLIHVQLYSRAFFSYFDTVNYDTYVLRHTGAIDTAATYTYLWEIGSVGTRNGRHEVVQFPAADTGYLVKLTVSDNYGCIDSFETIIYVFEELRVQNVFTPNNDNINDFFEIDSHGSVPLSIQIFTRTGTLVYKAEGYRITWDGRTSWGMEVSEGIYFYVLNPIGGDEVIAKRYKKSGFVYLFR